MPRICLVRTGKTETCSDRKANTRLRIRRGVGLAAFLESRRQPDNSFDDMPAARKAIAEHKLTLTNR